MRVPRVDEKLCHPVPPQKLAVILARRKAQSVADSLVGRCSIRIVVAADTVVSHRHHLLGKPANPGEATEMLRLLSGRTHQVITGICVARPGGSMVTGCEISSVKFRRLSSEMIHAYVSTGEPLDKAGAYGIQGHGALLVERIEGCYFNVVGLPLALLDKLLSKYRYKQVR